MPEKLANFINMLTINPKWKKLLIELHFKVQGDGIIKIGNEYKSNVNSSLEFEVLVMLMKF